MNRACQPPLGSVVGVSVTERYIGVGVGGGGDRYVLCLKKMCFTRLGVVIRLVVVFAMPKECRLYHTSVKSVLTREKSANFVKNICIGGGGLSENESSFKVVCVNKLALRSETRGRGLKK